MGGHTPRGVVIATEDNGVSVVGVAEVGDDVVGDDVVEVWALPQITLPSIRKQISV